MTQHQQVFLHAALASLALLTTGSLLNGGCTPDENMNEMEERPAGCEDIPVDSDTSETYTLPPVAKLCEFTEAGPGAQDEWTGWTVENPDTLECALTALRERTPGLLGWSWGKGGGYEGQRGYILINDDGTAIRRTHRTLDLINTVNNAEIVELQTPEHYDGCVLNDNQEQQFDCLIQELPVIDVCDEGWHVDLGGGM